MKYKTKRRGIMSIFFVLLIALALGHYFFKNFYFLLAEFLLALFAIAIFYFADHYFKIDFEIKHYLYFLLILFAGVIFSPIYFMCYFYDKILHFLMPIFACLIIYYLIDKLKIPFRWKLLITFCSVIASLAFLEIFEYLLDTFFHQKLQGVYLTTDLVSLQKLELILSKIDDTMIDLILGVIGSLIFVIGKIFFNIYNKRKLKLKKIKS